MKLETNYLLILTIIFILLVGLTNVFVNAKLDKLQDYATKNELQNMFNDSNLIQNQITIGNYIQAESQCLETIKKCQMLSDNNTSFTLGCFK